MPTAGKAHKRSDSKQKYLSPEQQDRIEVYQTGTECFECQGCRVEKESMFDPFFILMVGANLTAGTAV